MQRFLVLDVPSVILGALFVAIAVGVSVGGLAVVRHRTELEAMKQHTDVAGFIIAVVGVVYGVLLAFIVVIVWERFDEASQIATREGDLTLAVYRDAVAFPSNTVELRRAIRAYARSVVFDEWPTMESSQRDDQRTDEAVSGLFRAYRSVRPASPEEEIFLQESISRLSEIAEARRERIDASSSQLPGPMWVLVIVGALITTGFTYFFAVPNFRAHCLMVASLAMMIALTVFLVVSLCFPFSGQLAVQPTSMAGAIAEFPHLDASG